MATLPVLYPEDQSGPGRTTLMVQLKSTSQDVSSLRSLLKLLNSSALQVLHSPTVADANTTVIIADFPSPSDAQKVLDDSEFQKLVKGQEAATFEYKGSLEKTPKCGWYSFSYMKSKKEKQPALAAMLDAYLRGIFHCGTFEPIFHHVTMSREDPDIMISLQGWPSKEQGDHYWNHQIHKAVYPAVADLTHIPLSWEAELR